MNISTQKPFAASCYAEAKAWDKIVVAWQAGTEILTKEIPNKVFGAQPNSLGDIFEHDQFANRAGVGDRVILGSLKAEGGKHFYIKKVRHPYKVDDIFVGQIEYLASPKSIAEPEKLAAMGNPQMARVLVIEKDQIRSRWAVCAEEIVPALQERIKNHSCPVRMKVTREQPLEYRVIELA